MIVPRRRMGASERGAEMEPKETPNPVAIVSRPNDATGYS